MHIRSVKITRTDHYGFTGEKLDPSKPFICVVETESKDGKMELRLSPDLSHRILEIISEELAVSARETAEAMIASVFTSTASLSQDTQELIEAALPSNDPDDEIPF